MFYITGRIADGQIVETIQRYSETDLSAYKNAIAVNHGGASIDYDVFTVDENTATGIRISTGDLYTAVWDNRRITGLLLEEVVIQPVVDDIN